MRLAIQRKSRFEKDYKLAKRRGYKLAKLANIIDTLAAGQPLPLRHRDHALSGNWHGHRECHIEPDWLLIYVIEGQDLVLVRTGTHSDLFSK